jgi:uracil-DNA glycosylase
VTVGGLAARELLVIATVGESVGLRYELGDGTPAIPLPHPSGASSWLNSAANRARVDQALALVQTELGRLAVGA